MIPAKVIRKRWSTSEGVAGLLVGWIVAALGVVAVAFVGYVVWRRSRSRASDPPAKRVWVQNVDVCASMLEARLKTIRARRSQAPDPDPAADALDECVMTCITRARNAATHKDPVPGRVANWWRGTLIEAAYQNLHAAEALIVGLYDSEEVQAEIPEAVARVESGLARDDERRIAAIDLRFRNDAGKLDLERARAQLRKLIDVGHAAANQEHSRLRSFRNTVLISALMVSVLVVAFVWYVYKHPAAVPFCFTPPNEEGVEASWACPTGEYPLVDGSGPKEPGDVIILALLGLLGGSFSAAVAIKNLSGTSTPYDVPVALAALKLPLGALTAIGALIALQGDFVPGLSELDSQVQILAYALVFGYAQQLFTGLIDRRAEALLSTAPGKDASVARAEVHVSTETGPPAPTPQASATQN